VHCDVKPENVFLRSERCACLLDFGIARALGQGRELRDTSAGNDGAGTPMFMAPEQARPDAVLDPRTDLFSVGSMLLWCFSGGATAESAFFAGQIERWTSEALSHVPTEVRQVIDRAVALEASARWSSAKAMADALAGAHRAAYGFEVRELPSGECGA